MSGTTYPNLPLNTAPTRAGWTVDQEGAGPGATFKATFASIFGLMNGADIITALGYTPVNKAGDTMSGGLTLSAGALSVASGTVNVGNSAAASTSFVLNSLGGSNSVTYETAGITIWRANTDTGAWSLQRYSGGVPVDTPLIVTSVDGTVQTANRLQVGAGTGIGGGVTNGVRIWSGTAGKGFTDIITTANAGLTATSFTFASQAGTRTYTVPDAGGNATVQMTGATMASDGLIETSVPLMLMRNTDGTVVDATGAAGTFHIASTPGTSLGLAGADAKSATITSDGITEFVMPSTYVAGSAFSVVINALIAGTGTPGTKTLVPKVYAVATDGTQGSNLGPVAQNMTTSAADYTFAVTGTNVTAGKRILIEAEAVLQETGGANNINTQINSIRVK